MIKLKLERIELVGFVMQATPMHRDDALDFVWQSSFQCLVVACFGSGTRVPTGRDGVAVIGTGSRHPYGAPHFAPKLRPRTIMGFLSTSKPFEVCDKLLPLARQSRERLAAGRLRPFRFLTERALIVHASTD